MDNEQGTDRRIPLAVALNVFLLDGKARQVSARTTEHYETRLTQFVGWLAAHGVEHLSTVSANLIREYLVHEAARGLAATTVHTVARAVRAWLNFCVREGWLIESPMKSVAMPRKPKQVKEALTTRDARRMLGATDDTRDRAIFLLLLDTGIRASELCALNGGDVHLANGAVHVRLGKGAKDRIVYVGGKTLRALMHYYGERGEPGADEPVFLSELRRTRLTRYGLRLILQRMAEAGKVKECTPHTLRRTFALNCLRNGMNIYVLARLMGHEDIDVLRQYLPLVDADLQDQHRRFGSVDNL